MFEDEASFQLDPTLHRTWSPRGQQPRVPTRGERKTAHVFGALTVHGAQFTFSFVDVFNGATFLAFLKLLVEKYKGTKLFLIMDNGPCHNLNAEGKEWLAQHGHDIELHRLPAYSPEFNPTEGVWKRTRKMTTHNQFFGTTAERDQALTRTFQRFQRDPTLLAPQVERYC
jgi:transposase